MHIISHQLLPAHRRHAEALGAGRSPPGAAVLWVGGIGDGGGDGIREIPEVTGHVTHQRGAVLLCVVGDAASGCSGGSEEEQQDKELPAVPYPSSGVPGFPVDDFVNGVKQSVC